MSVSFRAGWVLCVVLCVGLGLVACSDDAGGGGATAGDVGADVAVSDGGDAGREDAGGGDDVGRDADSGSPDVPERDADTTDADTTDADTTDTGDVRPDVADDASDVGVEGARWGADARLSAIALSPEAVTLRWSAAQGDVSEYVVVVDGQERSRTRMTEASVVGLEAETLYRLRVDAVGGDGEVAADGPEAEVETLAEAPELVAPPLDPTTSAPFAEATEFLYAGDAPVQTDVEQGAIDPLRASVVRGRVTDRSGAPIAAVRVSVKDAARFGATHTRADGAFDLALESGAEVVLEYRRAGFLPAQRRVRPALLDYTQAPDVALVALEPEATTLTLSDIEQVTPVVGGVVEDDDGRRQATVLVPPGTRATMTLPDGTTEPLDTVTIRATEYTVGSRGPEAMPAPLPATSGYTYAVELSVDEALDAGAARVDFSQPLPFYVDNFLGFPVGLSVPLGYYDRAQARWIAAPDGRVVAVVAVDGGVAELDVDGDGEADSGAALEALGVSDAEREVLAERYAPGATLWRVQVDHFTPWDCNWPYGPPESALPPFLKALLDWIEEHCETSGSIVNCENQTLGERMVVAHTGLALRYTSDRAEGWRVSDTAPMPLTGAQVPEGVRAVELSVDIGGVRSEYAFEPEPQQTFLFEWDGQDAYGRPVPGQQPLRWRVDYVYDAVYYESIDAFEASFGSTSGVPITNSRARETVSLGQRFEGTIGLLDPVSWGVGGWTFENHHVYDFVGQMLLRGDGQRRQASEIGPVVDVWAGVDPNAGQAAPREDGPADGTLLLGQHVAVGQDGAVFVGELGGTIRKVTPEGSVVTVAGSLERSCEEHCVLEEGALASEVVLPLVSAMTVGPEGRLYFAEPLGGRIYRISHEGTVEHIGGAGSLIECLLEPCNEAEGALASESWLGDIRGLAVDDEGAVYLAQHDTSRVRVIRPDGRVYTVAGLGDTGSGFSGDGGPAIDGELSGPEGLVIAPDGALLIADTRNRRVRRVGPDGVLSTFAGSGEPGCSGDDAVCLRDGQPAQEAALARPSKLAVGPEGNVYITDSGHHRVRVVSPDGLIASLVGDGGSMNAGDGGLARAASVDPSGVAVGANGDVYVATGLHVRRVTTAFPRFALSDYVLASADGAELYRFASNGRHMETINALTLTTLWAFEYDPQGRLVAVVDGDGESTRVERDLATGDPTAIVPARGARTELTVEEGWITRMDGPEGGSWRMAYDRGLLTELETPRGHLQSFTYGPYGRLETDVSLLGGSQTLNRASVPGGHHVTVTQGDRERVYEVEQREDGALWRRVDDSGRVSTTLDDGAGGAMSVLPDGTTVERVEAGDPRFGMQAPYAASTVVTWPDGVVGREEVEREAERLDVGGWRLTERRTRNGAQTWTRVWDGEARAFVQTSPEGRQTTVTVDAQGRPLMSEVGGEATASFVYDDVGRLEAMTRGPLSWSWTYDAAGNPETLTSPGGAQESFVYDDAGRVVEETLADDRVVRYTRDAEGYVEQVVLDDGVVWRSAYNAVGALETRTLPEVDGLAPAAFTYRWGPHGQLEALERPGGDAVVFAYDGGGLLDTATFADGAGGDETLRFEYAPGTARMSRAVLASSGDALDITWAGDRPSRVRWSGAVEAEVDYTWDAGRRLASYAINGGEAALVGYDGDGLVVQSGPVALERDAAHGNVARVTLGAIEEVWSWTPSRTMDTAEARFGDATLYRAEVAYDPTGRFDTVTETVEGVETVWSYDYDPTGRLVEVRRDGVVAWGYGYDVRDNRTQVTSSEGSVEARYNARDQLMSVGDVVYSSDAAGLVTGWQEGGAGAAVGLVYDAVGQLRGATLPDGREVAYVVDGRGRRVGRRVDGSLEYGLVYKDQLNPIARLDADGQVDARFYYGARGHVPDAMELADGTLYRVIYDVRGSVRLVVNAATGEVAQRMDYDPLGRVLLDTNPGFQPFGFAGGLYDPETGLVRMGQRDYDPRIGRWTAPDPILTDGGLNLYAYASNDPVMGIDISGEVPVLAVAAPVVGGALLGSGVDLATQALFSDSINWCSVIASGVAGAAGGAVGVGLKSAGFKGFQALWRSALANGAISGGVQAGLNGVQGDPLTKGVASSALMGAGFDAAGNVIGGWRQLRGLDDAAENALADVGGASAGVSGGVKSAFNKGISKVVGTTGGTITNNTTAGGGSGSSDTP